MSEDQSSRKKWLPRGIKLLVAVVVVWAVRRTLYDAWNQLDESHWHLAPGWLGLSAALYLAGLLPAGIFWHCILRVMGQDARFGETIRAYFVGHLGKYVPGKAMVVVIRTALVRGRRIDTSLAAVSVFLETLTMMAVGACLAAAFLAASLAEHRFAFWGAVGLAVLSGLPTLPPVFKRLVRLAGVGRSDPAIAEKIEKLGYGTLLMGWGLMVLSWGLLGLSYWATLEAMGIPGLDPIAQLPRYTASVSLAMVAGFLLLVLPGGIGVREAALAELMIPYLAGLTRQAELAAWASAAVLRLVWLVSELVVSGILYPLGVRKSDEIPVDAGN
ncbi:MAG: lysylphosphatidylglycerol synthase transmembrane domain-containing protein [Planctomycetota bacterium]